uniref:Uncharacterized protein n=1 Tax=Arundo donax TaxID=35708 RepID=A0A0A8ZEV6_ARUDO
MKPSSFPEGTLNTHFSGYNFIQKARRLLNVSVIFEMRSLFSQVLTTTSSTYASTLRPSCVVRHC